MEKQQINPWTWQDARGFSQAWHVDGARSTLFISGQIPMSRAGELVGEGDFEVQARQVFENLETVLGQAGMSFDAIVRLGVYLTDISMLPVYARIKAEHIRGPQPASTAVEVRALAMPAMMIEVEAIAVA